MQLAQQSCVAAIRKANFPYEFKVEIESFIYRNALPDCGKVPPCCLKAHMVKKAKEMKFYEKIPLIKKLFKSRKHNGYYLDSGELVKL